MKITIAFLAPLIATVALAADPGGYYNRTIFTDDFSSNSFGPRWGHYKSGSVVKDGMLIGITPEKSDHAAVDSIRFPGERDLEVSVKFRFVSANAKSFNVWFDDKDYKGSHAGHICSVTVTPKAVNIADAKTGNFSNEIYTRRKSPAGLSDADKALLRTKSKSLPVKVTLQDWHTLVVHTKGDCVEVCIDGKVVGSFQSEGVGHDHKTLVSLTTNLVDVHYDDFSIKAGGAAAAKP
ncbi:MAG: hypothetical protein HZA88_18760 [Verrucomicrobia bacterium]|nr:hypothetical protein [Verrucomicrobiota bacterium]